MVLTVDHRLQKNSGVVARRVVRAAERAGLEARVLSWDCVRPSADIENAARQARYTLMGEWCRSHQIRALYLAHNLEDQAETFLLRLARGSGVDGLSAMRPVAPFPIPGFDEIVLVRPLLDVRRTELRSYLRMAHERWTEDPMNKDPRFGRTRFRALLPALEDAGLSAKRIADAATHLRRARESLDLVSEALIARYARFGSDYVVIDGKALSVAPAELALRSLATLLQRISGASYRPRFENLARLLGWIRTGPLEGGRTLHGCKVAPAPARLAVFRSHTLLVRPEPPRRKRRK